ncbi:SDR family NAD(P)-dependent oxidoreductase [Desulfogranum marinum]|uniref:SDR family NAD(P)-dependent oxidoreductase n=1 Tax=Desulfogranum marinum TaxID=453220 RepID=UPI0019628F40|nr:SDR family NAD(P)-dependent oxidoreductase [Desulfogranum marinum]MBM9514041.1 SDR family NAD(P)-dependent oxidoreductase [Desulfogranum marinum]
MNRVLITGSNRGLGLEFVRQYLEDGWRVYATCRRPAEAEELLRLAQIYSEVRLLRLDITKSEDISSVIRELNNIPINVLINNAGVRFKSGHAGTDCFQYDLWYRTFETNTMGTVRITQALLDNIEQSNQVRLVVVLSCATAGYDGLDQVDEIYYHSSKAALNVAMQGQIKALKRRKIGVLLFHPGRVMSRMGGTEGISPQQSVAGMRSIIQAFTLEQSGRLLQHDGRILT